jgi:hypothetical protein
VGVDKEKIMNGNKQRERMSCGKKKVVKKKKKKKKTKKR